MSRLIWINHTQYYWVSSWAVIRYKRKRNTFEPRHDKTCFREFPTKSNSNWPAQLQKLAWSLKFWLQKLETLHYLGSDQHPHSLICAFVVRIWHKTHFLLAWLIFKLLILRNHIIHDIFGLSVFDNWVVIQLCITSMVIILAFSLILKAHRTCRQYNT